MNKARRQKVSLSPYFWKDKLWKKDYGSQIMAANSLLKIFKFTDIVITLKDKDNLWITSLRTKGLEDKIAATKIRRERKEQFAKESEKEKIETKTTQIQVPNEIVKPQAKKTLGSLLD
jgi:hypothetical protein